MIVDDVRAEFIKDSSEKGKIARGSVPRANKKKYMFSSDYLHWTQKRKLNGEVTVYKMNEPISWVEFKSYPTEIQADYIKSLVEAFGCNVQMFSEIVNTTYTAVSSYFYKTEGKQELRDLFIRGRNIDRSRYEMWLAEKNVVVAPEVELKKVDVSPTFYGTISSCEMTLEGSAAEIGQTLFNMFRDQVITVQIVFSGKGKDDEKVV